ncbi:MAG: hypothetical protein AAF211_08755, partial [Myxococcota bacterium]
MVLGLAFAISLGWARPEAPEATCDVYPGIPVCTARTLGCELCHTQPPALGPFGTDLAVALDAPPDAARFLDRLPEALVAIEPLDSDDDGLSNRDELEWGTDPGRPEAAAACTAPVPSGPFLLCAYDPVLAYTRVSIDVCGVSPSAAELRAVRRARDPQTEVRGKLHACLDSDHWLGIDGVLWQVAFPKVRPREPFDEPIAWLYEQDLNLFVYTQTDDHDARDVLRADYRVVRDEGTPPTYRARPYDRPGDPDPGTRAGLLTTKWFHTSNTMGQAIPRVTAAQAYRAWLGYDLAVPEGVFPPPGALVDYDDKGVAAEACVGCHATLDPLAYLFARYVGTGERGFFPDAPVPPAGHYYPDRLTQFVGFDGGEGLLDVPLTGALFGAPGFTLVEWGRAAADSEAFARTLVADYWTRLVGHPPDTAEAAEFEALWRGF